MQKLLDALFGAPITPMDRIQIRRSWGEIVPGDHWSKSLAELGVRNEETLTVVDGRVHEKQLVVAPAPGTPQVPKKKKSEPGVNKRPTVRRKPRNKGW